MRSVLVFGGSGLVGAELAQSMKDCAFGVTPIVVDPREPRPECRVEGVQYVIDPTVNVFDAKCVLGLIEKYDAVAVVDGVNVASIASRAKSFEALELVMKYCFDVIDPVAKSGVAWLDIGTVATGGMGTEIPYTHSEASEGDIALGLKFKCAAAALHEGFLDLLGRTPRQRVGRVVPRAMIGFEPPFFGSILIADRGGMTPQYRGAVLPKDTLGEVSFEKLAEEYQGVGSRCGENGVFGREETAAITAIGQMETVTAKAVVSAAMDVFARIMVNSGTYVRHDVHPDVTSFAVRERVVGEMAVLGAEHGDPSVCYGNLGPYLSTHLWELWVLSRSGYTLHSLANFEGSFEPSGSILGELADRLPSLRWPALSDASYVPAFEDAMEMSAADVRAQMTRTGASGADKLWFVDLRTSRVEFWKEQAGKILGAHCERSNLPLPADEPIAPGEFWAAFSSVIGHGREAYSAGSRF